MEEKLNDLEQLDLLFTIMRDYSELTGYIINFKVEDMTVKLSMVSGWKADFGSVSLASTFMFGMYNGAYIAEEL